MNTEKFSKAMGEIDSKYVERAMNHKPKQKKHNWFKWGAMAACLCLVCIVAIPFMRKDQPANPDHATAPNIVLNGIKYFESPYVLAFEKCPDGFEYGGIIENGIAEGCPYYINPQIPEWIYVEQETNRIGTVTVDNFYIGYVRYVDENIRGKDFINYNGAIYVSMFGAEYPSVVDKALYDEVDSTYGSVIEASGVDGFRFAGTTNFEGFDVVPYNSFGSNTHQKEEQIYANLDNENVILVSASWETSSGVQRGFDVYIKTNYNYARHGNAQVLVYHGRYFSTSDLSVV